MEQEAPWRRLEPAPARPRPRRASKPAAPRRGRPPLAGVRVLDLTRVLAGPFCSMSLGDMGAEVIKVEEPGKGDDTRAWPPFLGGEATYFLSVNRNKKSLTLNLKAPRARRDCSRGWSRTSDVVLENFRPGTMERLGLGYEALAEASTPGSSTARSRASASRARGAPGRLRPDRAGRVRHHGHHRRSRTAPPVKVGTSIADLVAGMSAAQGITLALLARQRTGAARRSRSRMLDAMAALLTYQAGLYFATGQRPSRRRGNQHPSIVPYEVFKAADAYLTLGVANNSLWERICAALERARI